MKTFILLSAIPGSGKSTWAEQYRLSHENVHVVSSDEIRKELGGAYQNFDHEKEVWDTFQARIAKFRDEAEEVTVIADATNFQNKTRLIYAPVEGFDKKILVVIYKPIEQVLETNKKRNPNKIVPEDVVLRMYRLWEEPSEEVLSYFDEYQRIEKWFAAPKVKKSYTYKD